MHGGFEASEPTYSPVSREGEALRKALFLISRRRSASQPEDGTEDYALLAVGALSASQAVTTGNTFSLAAFDITIKSQ